MAKIPSLEELLKAGVHFGHRTSRWHPKMAQYIFGSRSGVHVIDIEKTQSILEQVTQQVQNIVANGGSIWFVGTKAQAQGIVEKYAIEAKVSYVNRRWLGGTFTNFEEIRKLSRKYLDLKDKQAKGELKKYTKLEQLQFARLIEELEGKIGGIANSAELPDAIFVLDTRTDKTAILEARKRGIKVIAICDTNVNPGLVDVVIPSNDDSVKALSLITRLIAESVTAGRAQQKSAPAKVAPKAAAAEVDVVASAKETVDELDIAMNEKIAKEKQELEKEAGALAGAGKSKKNK